MARLAVLEAFLAALRAALRASRRLAAVEEAAAAACSASSSAVHLTATDGRREYDIIKVTAAIATHLTHEQCGGGQSLPFVHSLDAETRGCGST